MRTNPGGMLEIGEIVGRDELIDQVWRTLEGQSVVLTAERRIGKTSVIRKMAQQPKGDWFPVLQDLEGIRSAEEFAVSVFGKVNEFLTTAKKAQHFAGALWEKIGGTEIGGVFKLPEGKASYWKDLLIHAIDDLVSSEADKRLVFFWDEIPYMVENIRQNQGEAVAMEVLDVLRLLRQSKPTFRMVLTGSVGMHHVLRTLRDKGYKNEPLNDMRSVEVPPFSQSGAESLASQLIAGEGLHILDDEQAARCIAVEADCFPFFIHAIVRYLKENRLDVSCASVRGAVEAQLVDANDPWQLAHFRTRIAGYYPSAIADVHMVLDSLCDVNEPTPVDAILTAIQAQSASVDRTRLLEILRLLERDHYVMRTLEGHYQFRYSLIRRWWKLDRGL